MMNVNYTTAHAFVIVQFAFKAQVILSGLSARIPKHYNALETRMQRAL